MSIDDDDLVQVIDILQRVNRLTLDQRGLVGADYGANDGGDIGVADVVAPVAVFDVWPTTGMEKPV